MSRSLLAVVRFGAILTALAAAPALAIDANGPTWLPREVVASGLTNFAANIDADRTLAFDHYGNAAIAFYDANLTALRYAQRLPGLGWRHAVVDNAAAVGMYMSLAFDRYERPAISYSDSTNTALKFAYFSDSAWSVQTVDSNGAVGWWSSLAFDLYGRAAIAYRDSTNGALKYVEDADGDGRLDDETPVFVTAGADDGRDPSLVFDAQNRPMIAHLNSVDANLLFSIRDPRLGWMSGTIDGNDRPSSCSLAVNPLTGNPAVAYYCSDNVDLRYASWDGNSWSIRAVDTFGSTGFYPSLAFDPGDGNPAIAYYGYTPTGTRLKLAWFDGAAWQVQVVDPNLVGGDCPSLAFNEYGDGYPAIAFFDNPAGYDNVYFIQDPRGVPEPCAAAVLLAGAAALLSRRRAWARRPARPFRFL